MKTIIFKIVSKSLLITLVLTAITLPACKDRGSSLDPSSRFSEGGPSRVRELGVYSGNIRVGDITFSYREGTWDNTTPVKELTEKIHLRLSFRGDEFEMSSEGRSWIDGDLVLLGGETEIQFGIGGWKTRTVRTAPGVYQREQFTGGSTSREKVYVTDEIILTDVLALYLHRDPGEVGQTRTMKIFNMTLGQELPFTSVYNGETEDGRSFTVKYWGMEEKLWLDENGMVSREEMALGVLAREPGKREVLGALPLEQVLSQTAVPASGIPEDLGSLSRAVFTIEGSFRPPPDTVWQTVKASEDRATVTVLAPDVPPRPERVPDKGQFSSDTFGLDLDSPRIRKLAEEITEGLVDPWEKALAINTWVYDNLGKSMRECFSALQVLETGEGECQSHSLLAASLCRNAGIPARFVYGVVYLPDRDAFLFHTWVDVHVGEWIPMDPTLGNFPAGVDHLVLATGGYRDQFKLFPFIMGQGGWRISFAAEGSKAEN
jgi:transglutaminase-like putative cysteine protease